MNGGRRPGLQGSQPRLLLGRERALALLGLRRERRLRKLPSARGARTWRTLSLIRHRSLAYVLLAERRPRCSRGKIHPDKGKPPSLLTLGFLPR